MMAFCPCVPVMNYIVTVNQHAQPQEPDTEAAKGNSAIIIFIVYTCAFSVVTCEFDSD